jgi:hypothetical protein
MCHRASKSSVLHFAKQSTLSKQVQPGIIPRSQLLARPQSSIRCRAGSASFGFRNF